MLQAFQRRYLHEGLDGIGVMPAGVKCAAQMAPEPRRMMRVELHRLADPVGALVGLPEPGQELAHLHDDQIVVGIECQMRAPGDGALSSGRSA